MAKIKVHLLNFHGIFSHIEIVLENTSTEPYEYYGINRWTYPKNEWSKWGPQELIGWANSAYIFDIEAEPEEITRKWKKYWYDTMADASILGDNCAVAAQWFLTEFAGIPKPSLSNVSWNHLVLGIVWPSFLPCPVTLPGRVMSNAEFFIEARNNPQTANEYTRLFLYTSMALSVLTFAASIFVLSMATAILSSGIAALVIVGCGIGVLTSTHAFFNTHNLISAKNIAENLKAEGRDIPLPNIDENVDFAPV